MDKQRWDQVKEIVGEALELSPALRGAYLEAACIDPKLRAEVETLISAHDKAEGFLELDAGLVGQQLGPYAIEAELGRGGMGVVYRAVRDQFEKRVAIKVVARGNPELLRRFDQERRILGRLQHPNIAAILDGGTTNAGAPYLVMELIDGQPIDVHCRSISTRDRVALFAKVCAAVSYAHQNLIVHRDLKPANILVTAGGEPKLLDFGIAKLIEEGELHALRTATMMPALTPAYASPEQVKNEPITTASDVYTLGVILYELLTGSRPYRVESATLPDLIEAVCETVPAPPSTAVEHTRELAGDLDTIVLMALRKEPERRYASVEALREDLQRYLDGRPVAARGEAVGYRLGKFVGRHRLALGAATAVVVALVAGVVATVRQAQIAEDERAIADEQRAVAERRFEEARQIARVFIADVDPAVRPLAGSIPVRRMIVDKGLLYLRRLAEENRAEPRLLLDLAAGYLQIGDILGHTDRPNLGDPTQALMLYEQSRTLAKIVVAFDPLNIEARRDLWRANQRIGRVTGTQGDIATGAATLRQALAVVDQSLALAPDNVDLARDRALTLQQLAFLQTRAGQYDAAIASYQQGVDAALAFRKAHPEHHEAARDVLVAYFDLARTAAMAEKATLAVTAGQAALELAEVAAREAPSNAEAQRDLAFALDTLLFGLVGAKRASEAVSYAERAVALATQLSAVDPRNAQGQRDAINAVRNLGSVLVEAGRVQDAVVHHEKAVALAEAAVATSPDDRLLKENLAASVHALGEDHAALRDHATAVRVLTRAVALKDELVRAAPGDTYGQRRLAMMLDALAASQDMQRDAAGAKTTRDRAAKLR